MPPPDRSLRRTLSLADALSIVVGGVIGTGVFLKTAIMAQQLGSPGLVLAAWVAAGLLSLAGALTYAELGALFPEAGGEYVYLKRAYGDLPAFLWGWMHVAVGTTGAIASLSIGFAIFLSVLVPMGAPWIRYDLTLFGQPFTWQFGLPQIVAMGAIAAFTALNTLSVVIGGRVQTAITAAKLLGLVVLVGGVLLFSPSARWEHFAGGDARWSGLSAFGAAMIAALWAYNGWYALPVMAGEVRDPTRNVPRGLIYGILCVMAVYLAANAAYFYALPFDAVASSNSTLHPGAPPVASRAVETFLGPLGARFVAIAFVVSTLGALNAVILAGARIPYAMAHDGLFFARLGSVSARGRVPVQALLYQGAWAALLAVSGSYDQLTTYTIFALWIFYGVVGAAVLVLRRKLPSTPRPYRTLGYPVVPLVLVLGALLLVGNTLWTNPVESAAGLVVIALGLPFYFHFRRRRLGVPAPRTVRHA